MTWTRDLPEKLLGIATLGVVAWDRWWLALILFAAAWIFGAVLEFWKHQQEERIVGGDDDD